VPIIVPAASFERFEELADHLGAALAAELKARGWRLGRDVAIAISADGIHYGPDFTQHTFGAGGLEAYQQATARDRGLLLGPLAGRLDTGKIRTLYETFVDPDHPDTYRWTWCGRFSIPLGLLTLQRHGVAGGLRDLDQRARARPARHRHAARLAVEPLPLRRLPGGRVHRGRKRTPIRFIAPPVHQQPAGRACQPSEPVACK